MTQQDDLNVDAVTIAKNLPILSHIFPKILSQDPYGSSIKDNGNGEGCGVKS